MRLLHSTTVATCHARRPRKGHLRVQQQPNGNFNCRPTEKLLDADHANHQRCLDRDIRVPSLVVTDAKGAGALDKLSRYEKTLMNNLDKALERLAELQDGRVEQAPNVAEA